MLPKSGRGLMPAFLGPAFNSFIFAKRVLFAAEKRIEGRPEFYQGLISVASKG